MPHVFKSLLVLPSSFSPHHFLPHLKRSQRESISSHRSSAAERLLRHLPLFCSVPGLHTVAAHYTMARISRTTATRFPRSVSSAPPSSNSTLLDADAAPVSGEHMARSTILGITIGLSESCSHLPSHSAQTDHLPSSPSTRNTRR